MKYLDIIFVLLFGQAIALKAQFFKNTSSQAVLKEIYAFDKIASPNSLDSLNHLMNLVYISSNYCDSTTINYHSDLVSEIYDMYPSLKSYSSISEQFEWDILNGMINLYFAEEEPFYNNQEALFKFNCVIFDIVCSIYSILDDDYKSICTRLVALSYINDGIRNGILQHWKNRIFSFNTQSEYINASSFLLYVFSYLSSNGEYENAITLELILLDKCKELFSDSSKYYVDCLQYLSVSYYNACNYPKAIELQKTILDWHVNRQVPDKDLKIELRNLRDGLFAMGNYQEARMYGERLTNSYGDKSSTDYLNDYSALAYCFFYSGERDAAIDMLMANINCREQRKSQNIATEYSSLSTLFRLNNDMVNSIKFAELALSSCNTESREYEDLTVQYHSLVNLGNAYYELNDIRSAFNVLNKAILIHNKLVALRRFDRNIVQSDIIMWTVLSRIYIISGNSKEAELALNRALDIAKIFYGEDNVNYLKIYAVLADIHLIKGDGTDALYIYDYVLKHLDPSSRIYYSYLSGYSDYCVTVERYEEAFEAIKKAYSKTNSTVDLIKLSRLEYRLGHYESLRKHLRVIFEQNKHLVNKSFLTYNNVQRKSYWWGPYVGDWFTHELPCFLLASKSADPLSIRTLYDAIIFSKGILLSTESDIRDLIFNSNNTKLISKYERFLQLNSANDSQEELKDYSYLTEESQLEAELMKYVKQHSTTISALNVTSNDIQRRLSSNSLAIEFMSVLSDTAAYTYYALVLEPDPVKDPQLIKMFDSNQLDMLDSEKYFTTQHLTNLIWLPLREYIQKYDTIYFAPCRQLNSIAIEYLPCIDGEGFMSDSYTIYRLSNTRELLAPDKITPLKVGLFGGMIYNADLKNMDSFEESIQGMIENVDSVRSGHDYLPNSKIEVEKVDSIMNLHKITSCMFTGLASTEENFRNLCINNCPRILHIATHGNYYSDEDLDYYYDNSELPFIKRAKHKNFYTEDLALTQSVLLFSGADKHSNGDILPSSNDGILTAKEIANLNLEDVDLVVLSACQSGLGENKEDGVFGLQRGFKKAGAKSLLMSLWDVDDHATQKLMVEFYKNYLSGKTKRESLHLAQNTLRQTENYKHPYYWAAWILLDGLN